MRPAWGSLLAAPSAERTIVWTRPVSSSGGAEPTQRSGIQAIPGPELPGDDPGEPSTHAKEPP
jgi:hypothetical protein